MIAAADRARSAVPSGRCGSRRSPEVQRLAPAERAEMRIVEAALVGI
jgi:hypothetical protein